MSEDIGLDALQDKVDTINDILLDFSNSREDFINRRINHKNFAKTIFWLSLKSLTEDYVRVKELAEFLMISDAGALRLINDFCKAELLKKVSPSGVLEVRFVVDRLGRPLIREYFEKAGKTLELKQSTIKRYMEKLKVQNF